MGTALGDAEKAVWTDFLKDAEVNRRTRLVGLLAQAPADPVPAYTLADLQALTDEDDVRSALEGVAGFEATVKSV